MSDNPPLNVLRYEPEGGLLDPISAIDYPATLHAGADAIEAGAGAADVAEYVVGRLDDNELDALADAARALGGLWPDSALSRLCLALDGTRACLSRFHPGYDPQGVADLVAERNALRDGPRAMTAREWLNVLAILESIDEVPAASEPVEWTYLSGSERQMQRTLRRRDFLANPADFLRRAPYATRAAIWAEVTRRLGGGA